MLFSYSDYVEEEILNTKCKDLLCKHITLATSHLERERKVLELSKKVDYLGCIWGYYHCNHTDLEYQKNTILEMERCNLGNSIRIVQQYNYAGKFLWVDNLHTLIRYIRKGSVYLKEVPFYLVRVSGTSQPTIIDYNNNLIFDKEKIAGVLEATEYRIKHSSVALCENGYTVEEFLKANPTLLT